MNLLKPLLFCIGAFALSIPLASNAALPQCQSAESDPDGDGYGWENNASCRVIQALDTPVCSDPSFDSDGDGYGWENNATCVVSPGGIGTDQSPGLRSYPLCSRAAVDSDGDGYGWENNASCVIDTGGGTDSRTNTSTDPFPVCAGSAADPDGDGYGWENSKTCIVGVTTPTVRAVSDAYPYRANSPYASVLKRCALISERENSCKLYELPFIGSESSDPTVEDIMQRVLVTHDWMGERFEQLLNNAPRSLLRMFQSLSVVVIGSDVNPSSYSILNASLKLDPYYLWLTVDEKRTIDRTPDFRTDYGSDLQFEYTRAFRKPDGQYLSYPSLSDGSEREFFDIVIPAVSVLYHELAHAVDFVPSWTLGDMNNQSSVYEAIIANSSEWLSPRLQNAMPNRSVTLAGLASVRYRDESATENEKNYKAADVGALFANDGAATFYSYSSIREDFANLVQTVMMKYLYNVSLGVYFYDKPTDSDPSCKVGWGVINRIGNASVVSRARWAVYRAVETSAQLDAFFANGTGVEENDRLGDDLCQSRKTGAADSFFNTRSVE